MAEHVIVETNWVVDFAAPSLAQGPAAQALLEQARAGELVLHVPALCLVEARKVVRERTARDYTTAVRRFIRAEREGGRVDRTNADAAYRVLDGFEQFVERDRKEAAGRIDGLRREPAVHVFPLDEAMLGRSVLIAASSSLELESFDLAILSAVLERARPLRDEEHAVSFCTLDKHLQPWDKRGDAKPGLQRLYDDAEVWVFGDFVVDLSERPDPWP